MFHRLASLQPFFGRRSVPLRVSPLLALAPATLVHIFAWYTVDAGASAIKRFSR